MKYLAAVTILFAIWTTDTLGADWPQWLGPDRNAISKESGLLQQWPEEGPPLAWRLEGLGGGYSAPAIAAGRLYGMSNRGDHEVVWCLSEVDGKELWATRLAAACQEGGPQGKEGPACTPTVDGDRLFVVGAGGDVACLKTQDGEIVWRRSFVDDFGGRLPMWRFTESPLVDGNQVICTPGGPEATLVALDKLTGETIWKSKVPENTSGDERANASGGQGRSGLGGRAGGPAPGGSQRGGPGGSGQRSESPATAVAGTKDPGLFESEHWGMRAFSCKIPNGKYRAKLYFAETFAGITGPGQRVFSINVQGHEIKDFDIWAKAGGPRRAYIETVDAEVTNGELRIVFTPKVENPAINAIEIVPQAETEEGAASPEATIRIKAGRSTPFTDSNGRVWKADEGFEGGSFGGMAVMSGRFGRGRGGFGQRPGGFGGGRGGFSGGRARAGAAYASAIEIDFDGQRQYVQLTANSLIGVAASDGKFLWRYDRPANPMGINCATPVYQDGLVFAASAYGAGGGAVKLSKDASGAVQAEEVYFTTRMQNHHGGMIVVDGCLYGADGGNSGGFIVCLDFQTGDVLWRDREAPKGSLTLADGRLYLRSEEGEMLLIEPNRERFVERGRFDQPERSDSPAWTYPVIANGRLYIRDQDLLLCYDVKAK